MRRARPGRRPPSPRTRRPDVLPENNGAADDQQGGASNTWLIVGLAVLLLIIALLLPRVLRGSTSRRRWSSAHSAEAVADAAWSEVRATAVDLTWTGPTSATVRANGLVVQREVVPTYEGRPGDRRRGHVRRADPLRPAPRAVGGHPGPDREGRRHLARRGLPGGGPQAGPAGALVPALGDPGGHRPAADRGARPREEVRPVVAERRPAWQRWLRSRSGRAGAASAPRAAA